MRPIPPPGGWPDKCPTGCGRAVRTGHLMCASCWKQVPFELRGGVYLSYRTWLHNLGDADVMRAYRQAADAAIASVR